MKNQQQKILFISGGLVFFICLFLVLHRLQVAPDKTIVKKQAEKISPTVILPKAKLYLKTKDGKTVYSQNQTIALVAYADSLNQPISGYDILLNYDQTKVKFLNQQNLLPEFQIFIPDKNKLTITGVKKLEAKSASIFNNTPLLELNFGGLTAGPVAFNIEYTSSSKKDSNLIDDQSKDILQQVQSLNILIGQSITLLKNQEVNIPNTKLTVNLKETTIPTQPCYDCVTGVLVEVKNDNNSFQPLNFRTGGIAGDMVVQQDLFGYRFQLEEVKENQVRLTLGKIQE